MTTEVAVLEPRVEKAPGSRVERALHLEGGLFGPDLLERLGTGNLPGQKPADFGLPSGRSLLDEIAAAYRDARDLWQVFRRRLERLPEDDPATSLTREVWVIPFFGFLGYDLHYNPRAYDVGGVLYAISHRAGEQEDAPPVHIAGARRELGRVDPSARPRLSPHGLMQEFLNRSAHLWGLVTNGRVLRLLRNSTYVRRQAYVEFDLEAIFEAEGDARFNDFVVLYRLLHRSRLPQGAADAHQCWLERYHQQAIEQGNRARDRLRDGVEKCLKILGTGFLQANPDWNPAPGELYEQLLRLVYRFLFLLVAEERELLGGSDLYREHYSISRLRRRVDRYEAYTEHDDLWQSLRVLFYLLRNDSPQVGGKPLTSFLELSVLDGRLFEPIELDNRTITNRDLLKAFFHLVYYCDDETRAYYRVNYAALDVEELGSVYESLLDHHAVIQDRTFNFAPGTERKSTGSYYTPPELVAELIRSALEPVIEERLEQAKRAASCEWRAVKETLIQSLGENHVHSFVSRLGSLAEGHGAGRADISPHAGVFAGGTLRPDGPDAPGSSVRAGEHRRGLGTAGNEGVSAVPEHRLGQPAGAGNLSPAGSADQPDDTSAGRATAGLDANLGQTTHRPPAQPLREAQVARLWDSLPLAARRSLLATHALLTLRVLDPACGSGHFLLAAARRLGKELAKIRTGEEEPAPERVREATREVIGHCIYGVDKNPLAVELCKVALWIESQVPGKPLTFLDHRIRCGDSLVGVLDLGVLQRGIPDEAFVPVSTDSKETANLLKKRNRNERRALESGQLRLPFAPEQVVDALGAQHHDIEAIADDSPAAVREKKSRYDRLLADRERLRIAEACDLWTAAFFQRFTHGLATSPAVISTDAVTDRLADRAHPQALAAAQALAHHHRFFHWPLEFPEVFQRAASGEQRAVNEQPDLPLAARQSPLAHCGFDVVLSNPPWERIKLQEEEFFASRDPEIARAPNAAARKRLIARLKETNPALWRAYQEALHDADATSKFLRTGGRYPLTGRGDINTYSVFAELAAKLIRPRGRAGIVVPTGIATDATNQHFFRHLVESGRLVSLYDFENRKGIFPGVHRSYKFCLLTLQGEPASGERRAASGEELAEFAFFCQEAADLRDAERRFTLSPLDFRLLNPNTGTAPIFRSRRDAELTKHIYRRVPVLVNERAASREQRAVEDTTDQPLAESELLATRHSPLSESNPWGVEFLRMFDMANDSHLFRTREELEAEGFRLEGNVFVMQRAASGEQRAGKETSHHSPFAIRYLPLYEAKMIHQFDHRFGDYRDLPKGSRSTQLPEVPLERLADPTYQVLPRYWVPAEEVEARLAAKGWTRGWLLGWRDITNVTNERTVIAAVIPRVGVGHKYLLMLPAPPERAALLVGTLDSLPFDYCARQKVGGTSLKYFTMKQLPVLPPAVFERPCPWSPGETLADWLRPRVLELTYTAWDLAPFAEDLWASADDAGRQAILRQWEENHGTPLTRSPFPEDAGQRPALPGDHSPLATRRSPLSPFRYDPERRFQLRCELDAAFFILYLGTPEEWAREATPELKALFPTPREAVAYILEQFPIIRRKDEERHSVYRTKETILKRYDEMCR